MGNSLRRQPLGTIYGELKTPVTEDVLQVGLLFAFGIIAFSFLVIIPGIRGIERIWATLRVFIALWIGTILLVCNFSSWYGDKICSRTPYKAHTEKNTPQLIQAEIGLSIALRGINITLFEKACPGTDENIYEQERPFPDETINYNERFRWGDTWQQGRLDFGIFGGQFNQAYRQAKYRGMPYPITWIAEHFTLDGEQILWYRKFRVAGWYTHIWLWTAFATYLISILLFLYVIRWGAYYLLITGLLMVLACATYGLTILNDPPLEIHFYDGILKPHFNISFYLVLFTGLGACIIAILIVISDYICPRKIAQVFHHSIIADDIIFQDVLEDEEGNNGEFGIVSKGSQISFERDGSRKGRKLQRKGTLTHVRDSVRSTRSGVLSRKESAVGIAVTDEARPGNKEQEDIQLEEITIIHSKVDKK